MPDTPSDASARADRPIFIVGPMGSGTTLMRLIVDSHPDIAIAQETSIGRAILAHRWIPFHRHGGDWYGRLGWSDEELDERLREFYSGMFERFAASHGKKRWGDKTPWHAWQLRDLARVFPDAVFIAMVRHPGAVAESVDRRFRQSWKGAVGHWVNLTTEQVQRGIELGDRLLMVRYEDLVTEPEPTLREVFSWLDEPWTDRLLRHEEVHAERGTAKRVEGNTRSDKPIDTSRIAAWTEGKTPDQLEVLARRAGKLATFYGYDIERPLALDPWGVSESARKKTLTGTELAQRKESMPELAGPLERTVKPWAGNRLLTPDAFGSGETVDGAAPPPKKPAAPAQRAVAPAPRGRAPSPTPAARARSAAAQVRARARTLGGRLLRR